MKISRSSSKAVHKKEAVDWCSSPNPTPHTPMAFGRVLHEQEFWFCFKEHFIDIYSVSITVVSEALDGVSEGLDGVSEGLDKVSEGLDGVSEGLNRVSEGLDGVSEARDGGV
ncbi:hypothetical protein H671_1g3293 [Cricetulus griseus]|nr:hypothetical protein H671_1g3293 [Cricetulus griseus]